MLSGIFWNVQISLFFQEFPRYLGVRAFGHEASGVEWQGVGFTLDMTITQSMVLCIILRVRACPLVATFAASPVLLPHAAGAARWGCQQAGRHRPMQWHKRQARRRGTPAGLS